MAPPCMARKPSFRTIKKAPIQGLVLADGECSMSKVLDASTLSSNLFQGQDTGCGQQGCGLPKMSKPKGKAEWPLWPRYWSRAGGRWPTQNVKAKRQGRM